MKNPISKRQKDLLAVIYEYIKNTGYPPAFDEMKDLLGVSSNQSVIDLLDKLERKEILKRKEGTARSIAILPLGYDILGQPYLTAFLGATSAGAPIEALEIRGNWIEVPSLNEKIEKLEDQIFALKIYGDSMINAGIDDGDVVLVQSKKEFVSGEVVLAEQNGDTTVKRFISEDKPPYVYLKPENPKYKNILFEEDTELKGKVISVLKNGQWRSIK